MSNRLQKRALRSNAHKPHTVLLRPCSDVVESLEQRLLLAAQPLRTIHGQIFNDLNGNGTRQGKEHWLAGVAVYVDLNGNSLQDAGEPAAVTNKQGAFTFRKLPRGTYDVIAIAPTGDVATKPTNGLAVVDVVRHGILNLRFGFKTAPAPPVVTTPDTSPPSANLNAPAVTTAGFSPYRFMVTWSDATAVDASSFGDGNVVVTGPDGYDEPGNFVALDATGNGSPRTTTYQIPAPADGWTVDTDGVYTVTLNGGQVRDTLGNIDGPIALGTFSAEIPAGVPGTPSLIGGVNNATTANNASVNSKLSFDISNTIAGAQLSLSADGIPMTTIAASAGTTVISTNGSSVFADGPHQFAVTQTLSNGVAATSPPVTIAVDTTGPTETLAANAITAAGGATYSFTVTYTDATAVSVASLNGNGLIVTAPSTQRITPTLVSLDSNSDGPSRVATYQIAAPGGSWTGADNGSYSVTLLANSVFDEVHNAATGRVMGNFTVSIGQPLSPTPGTPVLLPASDTGIYNNDGVTNLNNSSSARELHISVPGTQSGAKVTVFSDGTPIGTATASGTATVVTTNGSTTLSNGGHLLTAEQIVAGDGASDASVPSGIVIDTKPPTARSNPAPVSGFGATVYTFAVVYRDDIAVDASHLGTGDIVVTGPSGFTQTATLVGLDSRASGSPRTATYAITPPGGSWQPGLNATFTISTQSGQIFDTAGNSAPAATVATFSVNTGLPASPAPGAPALLPTSDSGVSNSDNLTNGNNSSPGATLQFNVGNTVAGATITIFADGTPIGATVAGGTSTVVTTNGTVPLSDGAHTITARQTVPGDAQSSDSSGVSITIDTTAPTLTTSSAPAVTTAGATSYTFTATYADAQGVNVATLGNGNIIVTGPNNVSLPATFVSSSPSTNSKSVTVTYQITPPAGAWDATDNGNYAINLQAGQLGDTAGNVTGATSLGGFSVNIAAPPTPTPGVPILEAISDTGPNQSDDLTNLNNGSTSTELSFDVSGTIAGATVTVYSGSAPIGAAVASGSDTVVTTKGNVTLGDGSRTITATQTSPGSAQSANSAALVIVIDTVAPTAGSLSAPNVSLGGGTTYQFTVTYTDNRSVDLSSLGNSDIIVNGPGNSSLAATFISASTGGNSGSITATYQITPPGGSWNSADNGNYTVALQAGQVRDTSGNAVAAGNLGSFSVNVAAAASPTPSTPILAVSSDTGTLHNDNLTNLNNSSLGQALQFTVASTVAGATVTIYSDGTPIGATVANGTTTTVTTTGNTPISDGVHVITARQQSPGQSQSVDSQSLSITVDTNPPTATVTLTDVTTAGGTTYTFTVTYSDNIGVDPSTFDSNDIVVTGPNGFNAAAGLSGIDNANPGSPRTATYVIIAPSGGWSVADDGVYTVTLNPGQVFDTAGNSAPGGNLGTFNVNL